MRPSSSPMMAKMKSVCAFGRKFHLARPGAEPDAGEPAAAERDERLRDLVAGVRRVGERVEEREHAAPAGTARRREERDRGDAGGADDREVARPARPPTTSTASDDEREHDRRAEVGLLHHEQGEPGEDQRPPAAATRRQSCSSPARRLTRSAA